MVCEKPVMLSFKNPEPITQLSAKDLPDMLNLINLVQPGFFFHDTPLLGDYFGIRINDQLVAITGERLRITNLTEVSAVVTHPLFTGKGFAQQLITHVMNKNSRDGSIPFLHFVAGNDRAQKIYELLGFERRRIIPFWGLTIHTDRQI